MLLTLLCDVAVLSSRRAIPQLAAQPHIPRPLGQRRAGRTSGARRCGREHGGERPRGWTLTDGGERSRLLGNAVPEKNGFEGLGTTMTVKNWLWKWEEMGQKLFMCRVFMSLIDDFLSPLLYFFHCHRKRKVEYRCLRYNKQIKFWLTSLLFVPVNWRSPQFTHV